MLALRETLKQAGRNRSWSLPPSETQPGGRTVTPLDLRAVQQPARQLHDWLIAPIAEDSRRAEAKVLMVYLYGEKRYLPLAALYDGNQCLAERYALALYTDAAKHLDTPRQIAWKVAGLGVSAQHPGFEALPAVPGELEGIVRHGRSDKDGVLPARSTWMRPLPITGERTDAGVRNVKPPVSDYPTLSILGIAKSRSFRWRSLADMSDGPT